MIIEFSNPEQMKQWREVCAPVEKYLVYVTSEKEVVLRPTRSTNTLDYGYYEATTKEKLDDIMKSLTDNSPRKLPLSSVEMNWRQSFEVQYQKRLILYPPLVEKLQFFLDKGNGNMVLY